MSEVERVSVRACVRVCDLVKCGDGSKVLEWAKAKESSSEDGSGWPLRAKDEWCSLWECVGGSDEPCKISMGLADRSS